MIRPGQIFILNGAPRSGKSSIALAIQESFPGNWKIFGVDVFTKENTPAQFRPGIGLRPGGEQPDLEPAVSQLYATLHAAIAAQSRDGNNVIVDVGYHDSYSAPLQIRESAAKQLAGLPVLFVGVRCSIEVIMERRNQGPDGLYVKGTADDPIPEPVRRWQEAVHIPGIYDMEVDTSLMSTEECAGLIRTRLDSGLPNDSFWNNGTR